VSEDCLKLTLYFGERDRHGDGFLADALTDVYARHELRTSLLLRGVEGFGAKHQRRTDRVLTLSEDLPLVSVAVDTRARVEAALREIEPLRVEGLLTLERARMVTGAAELDEDTKLTLYVGRQERIGGRPAYEVAVERLHAHGVAGASVLLGVDGTAHGARQRARFFGRNAQVPLMVISVGRGKALAGALAELADVLERPLITLERIRVCKRDGVKLAEPQPAHDGLWQKLMVYSGEQSRIHTELVRALRRAGAAGATSLRGIWGYHGDHAPHGDSFWQLRRRVPVVTVIIDAPERIGQAFAIVDRVTRETGLVTSELVRASARA
jgi:PII-like signaling protein